MSYASQCYKTPEAAGHVCVNELLATLELAAAERARLRINAPGRIICSCPECFVGGVAQPLHRSQDCQYAAKRSELVEKAFEIALEKSNGSSKDFMRVFSMTMEEMSAPLLRS